MAGSDENENKENQTGAEEQKETGTQDDAIKTLNEKIAKLSSDLSKTRAEAANYRVKSKDKETVEETLASIQKELENTKKENITVKRIAQLEKAGCLKSELVAREIPEDCDDIIGFIKTYKENPDNAFLFGDKRQSHGGAFKPAKQNNTTPSQQMNSFIRSATGRQ